MGDSKIDPKLLAQMRLESAQASVPVIVRHKGARFFSQAIGDVVGFSLFDATAMRMKPADIHPLSDDDDIEYIWADLPVHTCLDVSVPQIGVPQIWQDGWTGAGIKLAIVDTGIDSTHPDFAGRIAARKNFAGGSAEDENGHGTHVAGIAAGTGAASNGKYRGVAPEATLYIAKVLDKDGGGSMSGVMAGVEWAVEQGAQVINLSLGSAGAGDGTDALSTLCDAAVQQKGVVVCVAAGNEGPAASTVGAPGCAKLVITIGATDDGDRVTAFSSRGPTTDGRVKPDLVFPGFGIVSAQAAGTQLGSVIVSGYISLNGTSMATPHASGSACLLLQANKTLSPGQIKEALQSTALNLNLPANTQGTGRAQVYQALERIMESTPPADPTPTPQPTPTPTPGEGNKGCFPETLAKWFGQ